MHAEVVVILATRNGRKWISEQLASILSQEGVEVRVCVFDDASTDGTPDLIPVDSRVSVCRRSFPTGGAGANFRSALTEVEIGRAEFIAFADQDDVWLPGKLARAVDHLRRSGAGGYSAAVEAFWPDGRRRTIKQSARQSDADFLFEGGGQGCTFVFGRTLFELARAYCLAQRRGVSDLHFHDWLIYLIARAHGLKWYFDQTPVLGYRQHTGNDIGARGSRSGAIRRLKLLWNGWYVAQVAAASHVYLSQQPLAGPAETLARLMVREELNLSQRLTLSWLIIRHGRRRVADKLVTAVLLPWRFKAGEKK